ncbi:MAG: GntR family transcriptional regulator [Candidatus Sumerlaeota bacterium]
MQICLPNPKGKAQSERADFNFLMPIFEKTSHLSKKEAVYTSLLKSIVTGDLQPGDRIIIDDLARKFGHSHIPVREAVQQLAAEGFVEIRPYAGATVSRLGLEAISEIFELLEALELIAARVACERITQENIADLKALLQRMDTLQADVEQWSNHNFEFHENIIKIAGYTLTMNLLENVRNHWNRVRRVQFPGVFQSNITEAQKEHWLILEALQKRDAAGLENLLRQHNRKARESYLHQKP